MIKIGVLGIGNAGGQVASLAASEGFDVLALNSSEKDLKTIDKNVPALVVGDEKGAGKDRATAKHFIREIVKEFIQTPEVVNLTTDKDVVVIVSSTGGGTGSGMAPVLQNILSKSFPNIHFIISPILPMIEESLAEQQNSAEYLTEMLKTNPTYMVYDNNSKAGTSTKADVMLKINHKIVRDLKVMRGDYQSLTPYASIDEKDMMRMLTTPGRLIIEHVEGFKEMDVDEEPITDRIIEGIKNTGSAVLESDRSILRMGLIYNLNNKLYKTFNQDAIKDFLGTPVEGFEHILLDDEITNSVSLIGSGLSFPDDRIEKIANRIEELKQAISQTKGSKILGSIETDEISRLRKQEEKESGELDLDALFAEY